jgi:HemY protein
VALVLAIRAIQSLVSLPERAQQWRMQRRERAAQAALREALSEYFGARYSRAQKAALRVVAIQDAAPEPDDGREARDTRALAHLLAGASLHRLQDRTQRDRQFEALRMLRNEGGGRAVDDGMQLMAAEWALDDRDAARALSLLAELPPGAARRTQALRLRLQAQRLAGDTSAALHTAHLLAKHQAFSPASAQSLLRSLAFDALEVARDAEQLERVWQQLEAVDREDAFVVARAARRAGSLGASARARAWLQPMWERIAELPRDERDAIALALMHNLTGLPADWLARVQAADQALPHDAPVQAAVGCAYAERQLWGKARAPLERAAASLTLPGEARRTCWRRLAALARAEGDEARAARCDREGAAVEG